MSRQVLNISKDGNSTAPLGNVPVLDHSQSKKWVFFCLIILFCFSLFPLSLVLSLVTTEKSLSSFSLLSFIRYLYRWSRAPWAPALSSPPCTSDALIPSSSLWHFAELVPVCPCLSGTEELRTGANTSDVLHQCWVDRKDHLPWLLMMPFLMQPRRLLAFFAALFQLAAYQEPQGQLYKAIFQLAGPNLSWCVGLFLPMWRAWHFPLLNFMGLMKFTWSRGILAKWLFIMHRKHISVSLLLHIAVVNKLIANLRAIFWLFLFEII